MIREAKKEDIPQVVRLFRFIRNYNLAYLPILHTAEEDYEFFNKKVLPENELLVAEEDGKIVGFIAFNNKWVNHLYILPEFQGQGLGRKFLDKAKENSQELSLWVFQKNSRARKFYEENGFVWVKDTDGSGNEEKEPDSLYTWKSRTRQI